VGRKSREKRERHDQVAEARRALGLLDEAAKPQADVVIVAKAPPRRRKPRAPVGARVARVAVDDATWAEFRELCGATPASVRLGQLVEAAKGGNAEAMYGVFFTLVSKSSPEHPITKADEELALYWLIKAGENNNFRAALVLSGCYEIGCFGLPIDVNKAKYYKGLVEKLRPN